MPKLAQSEAAQCECGADISANTQTASCTAIIGSAQQPAISRTKALRTRCLLLRPRDVPPWASAYGGSMAKALAAKMIASGVKLQDLDSDMQVSCEWTTGLLAAISEKPAPVAANLYRWLIAGGK